MKKILVITFLIMFSFAFGQNQPPVCGLNPAMTSFCQQACIICDIDGFTGRNDSNIRGQAPPGFCTMEVHHMQWIGFIAGTQNLEIEVRLSNCQLNRGLEIGLYESFDCVNFRQVSDCDTDIRPTEIRVFKNTVPLVVGQYYYFVMDGNGNDICDWSIKVLNGSTKVSPLDIAPPIDLPSTVCQHDTVTLFTAGLTGATFYKWTIQDSLVKYGTTVKQSFSKPGIYKVCLDASNVCDVAPQICKNMEVLPEANNTIRQEVCYGECFNFLNNDYCTSGKYDIILTAANGCDSILTLDLIVDQKVTAKTTLYICEGDTLSIGNGKLTTAGKHEVIIDNQEGCRIYLEVDLYLIECQIQTEDEIVPVRCTGETSGVIRFAISVGTPPMIYEGFKIENPSIKFSGNIFSKNDWVTIYNVDEGYYTFTIRDTFGNSNILTVFVPQPPPLKTDINKKSYNGFEVSCFEASDGEIIWLPGGGTPPYQIKHTFNDSGNDTLKNLSAGIYFSEITDGNGCIEQLEIKLNQPPPISSVLDIYNPDCNGPNTGWININNTSGGIPPYKFSINEQPEKEVPVFSQLQEGLYQIMVTDKNGCTWKRDTFLIAAEIPILMPLFDSVTISLGDSLTLDVLSNLQWLNVRWTPNESMACPECLKTTVLPVNNQVYKLKAVSKDGCETYVEIKVKVDKTRSFVMSNIHTPERQGNNQEMRYFAGKDVDKILFLSVFDRWGNMMFEDKNPSKGLQNVLWDGIFLNKAIQSGSFTWLAAIRYLDGEIVHYTGSWTVLR